MIIRNVLKKMYFKVGNVLGFFEKQINVNNKPEVQYKIGKIKIFKSREINGNIKLARVVKKADGYYLQIITDHEIQKCENQAVVGVDLGIKHFLITSDGQFFENIKTTDKYKNELRIAQRRSQIIFINKLR